MIVYVQYDNITEEVVCVHAKPDMKCGDCIRHQKWCRTRYGNDERELCQFEHVVKGVV